MPEIETNLLHLSKGEVDVLTGPANKITAKPVKRHILEVEDNLFHFNSAVLMPEAPEKSEGDQSEATAKQKKVGGLDVLRACILHAIAHPDQLMIVAGHTDTSGQKSYNLTLSQQRSDNVFHALMGHKDDWVKIAKDKHKVEDYKQILKWAAKRKGWPCDPGEVNNTNDQKTKEAVKAFQDNYNKQFGKDISVDGIVGDQTWGAIFDLYEEYLAEALNMTTQKVKESRDALKFLDDGNKSVGCGEHHPIDAPDRDGFRSAQNRRVEILFFDPDEKPKLDCHPGPGKCNPDVCQIYDRDTFGFTPIPVTPIPPKVPTRIDITKIETTNPKKGEEGEPDFLNDSDFTPRLDEKVKIHLTLSHFLNGFTGKLRMDIARLIAPEDDKPADAGKFGFVKDRKKVSTHLDNVRAAIDDNANAQDKALVTGKAQVAITSKSANGLDATVAGFWTSKGRNVPIVFHKLGDGGLEEIYKSDDGWNIVRQDVGTDIVGIAHNNGDGKLDIIATIELDSERKVTTADATSVTSDFVKTMDQLCIAFANFQLIKRFEQDISIGAKPLKLEIEWDGNAGEDAARKYSNRRTRNHHDNKLCHVPMEKVEKNKKTIHGLYVFERITVLEGTAEKHNQHFKTTSLSVPQISNLTFNANWANSVSLFGLAPFQSLLEEGLRRYGTRDYMTRDATIGNRMNVRFITNNGLDNTVTFRHTIGGVDPGSVTLFGSTPGPDGPPTRNIYGFFDALKKNIKIFPDAFLFFNTKASSKVLFQSIFSPLGVKADTDSSNRNAPNGRSVAGDGTVTGATTADDFDNVTVTQDDDGLATVASKDTSNVPNARASQIQRAMRAFVKFMGNTTNHEQGHAFGVSNEPRASRKITIDGVTVTVALLGDAGSHNATTTDTNIVDPGSTRPFKHRIEDGHPQQVFAAINAKYLRDCLPFAPPT